MNVSRDEIALLEKQTGVCPLPTQDGIRYWEDFLRSDALQGIALYGIPSRIDAYIARNVRPAQYRARRGGYSPPNRLDHGRAGNTRPYARGTVNESAQAEGLDAATLVAKTEAYLKEMIGEEIKLAPDRIGSSDRFESFGVDSVMIARFNANLEWDLGALPKTLFYEYETVAELARFLLEEAREPLVELFGSPGSAGATACPIPGEDRLIEAGRQERLRSQEFSEEHGDAEPIAIIGIHAHYPHSANLNEYW